MIDATCETLITFAEASRMLPARRGGKRVHLSTWHRWATKGSRGVRLEVVRVGSTLCTSREAVGRFLDRLTKAHPTPGSHETDRPSTRRAAHSKAERDAEQMGI